MSCCLSLKSQFLATAFLSYAIVLLVVCERILLIFRPLMIASCRMIRCDVIFAGEGGVHRGGPHAEGRRGEKASRYIYIYEICFLVPTTIAWCTYHMYVYSPEKIRNSPSTKTPATLCSGRGRLLGKRQTPLESPHSTAGMAGMFFFQSCLA